MKILVTGSHGFIGQAVTTYFRYMGDEVIPLVRNKEENGIFWDPENRIIDPSQLENFQAVIHLAGENIFGRWTQKKKEKIRKSRVETTEFLVKTLKSLASPPKIYIGASAIGYYGNRGNEHLTEKSPPGNDFLARVCQEWESVAKPLEANGVRVILTRFGIVLGKGGALAKLSLPFELGMGGKMGSGDQIISWMALDDLVRAMHFVIQHSEIQGPVNFVSPQPVSNKEFTRSIGSVLKRPTMFPVPRSVLKLAFGEGGEIYLNSTYVVPQCLIQYGFSFLYPELKEVLKKYLIIDN